jgi:formate hydrogenlyase subunit 6/NADH:ubiquinone oxidoreductase subunit I
VFEDDSCKKLVFGCSQATEALGELIDASLVAQVVCAGRVDESILCELAASGVSDIEILCGACEACAQKHGLDTANLVVETTCELFAAWNVDCAVSVAQTPPSAILSDGITQDLVEGVLAGYFADGCECEPILSAQQASEQNEASLKSDDNAVNEGDKRARERDDDTHGTGMRFYWESTHSRHVHKNLHVMKDGTLPHFLPERRNRVLNALSAFGEPEVRGIETRLMGTVAIDVAKCVSCRMCAVFCPTGAIAKFDEPDGTVGINHMPADCIKCESCKDICPAQAIVINDEVSTGYILEGRTHRYVMDGRDVSLRDNPHQMLETMRKNIPGDIFER